MKIEMLFLVIGLVPPLQAARNQDPYYNQRVSGYERQDGTYVEPYYRHHDYQPEVQPVYQPAPVYPQPVYQYQPIQVPLPSIYQYQPVQQPNNYWNLNQ